MRKSICILTIILFFTFKSKAQDYSNARAQNVYGEILGNGLLFSVNYDTRFANSDKGLGMRVGAGFLGGSGGGILTIPVGLNHLSGRAPHYFEAGIGYTYATITGEDDIFDSGSSSFLVPSIGYRYQAVGKGFIGRVVLSPLIFLGGGGGWTMFGGVAAGFKFH